MEGHQATVAAKPTRRSPWNKGKLVGAKPALRPSHVWSIRTKLQMQRPKVSLRQRPPCGRSALAPSRTTRRRGNERAG
jgi:hypothetical protein